MKEILSKKGLNQEKYKIFTNKDSNIYLLYIKNKKTAGNQPTAFLSTTIVLITIYNAL